MKQMNQTLKRTVIRVSGVLLAHAIMMVEVQAAPTVTGLELLDGVGRYPANLKIYRAIKPSAADLAERLALGKNLGKAAGLDFDSATPLGLDKTRNALTSKIDPSASFEYDSGTGNFLFNAGMQSYRTDDSTKNLPQDSEVEALAGKWLNELGLRIDPRQLTLAHVGGLNMAAADGNGGSIIYEKLKTVRFSRVLDGLPVEGDGRLVVHLGESAALAGMVYQWPTVGKSSLLDRRQLQDPQTLRDSALKQIHSVTGKAASARLTQARLSLYDDGRGLIEPAYHFVIERYFDYGDREPVMIPYDFYIPVPRQPVALYPHMETALLQPASGSDTDKIENNQDE